VLLVVEGFQKPWIQRFSFVVFLSALLVVVGFQKPWIQRFSFVVVLTALLVVVGFQKPWIQLFSFCLVLSALVAVEGFQRSWFYFVLFVQSFQSVLGELRVVQKSHSPWILFFYSSICSFSLIIFSTGSNLLLLITCYRVFCI
jgi:hypothetical protein